MASKKNICKKRITVNVFFSFEIFISLSDKLCESKHVLREEKSEKIHAILHSWQEQDSDGSL